MLAYVHAVGLRSQDYVACAHILAGWICQSSDRRRHLTPKLREARSLSLFATMSDADFWASLFTPVAVQEPSKPVTDRHCSTEALWTALSGHTKGVRGIPGDNAVKARETQAQHACQAEPQEQLPCEVEPLEQPPRPSFAMLLRRALCEIDDAEAFMEDAHKPRGAEPHPDFDMRSWPFTGAHLSHGIAVNARESLTPSEFGHLIRHDLQWRSLLSWRFGHWSRFKVHSRAFDNWIATGLVSPETSPLDEVSSTECESESESEPHNDSADSRVKRQCVRTDVR